MCGDCCQGLKGCAWNRNCKHTAPTYSVGMISSVQIFFSTFPRIIVSGKKNYFMKLVGKTFSRVTLFAPLTGCPCNPLLWVSESFFSIFKLQLFPCPPTLRNITVLSWLCLLDLQSRTCLHTSSPWSVPTPPRRLVQRNRDSGQPLRITPKQPSQYKSETLLLFAS